MKISGDFSKIPGIYGKNKITGRIADTGNTKKKAADDISISEKGRDFQTALRALKDIPDIRAEKVRELAEKIDAGAYRADSGKIAEGIVRKAFDKKV